MFFLFKDFAATLFSFEVWIAYLRLSESAKLDVLNGWLNKNTFPTWRLAWSQSWEDTNWLIWPILNKQIYNKNFWIESDHYFPKTDGLKISRRHLHLVVNVVNVSHMRWLRAVISASVYCTLDVFLLSQTLDCELCSLTLSHMPCNGLFFLWGGKTKKTCNSHFSCASWSTAKSPDMSKTLGQSKRFPKLFFNLQFSQLAHFSLSSNLLLEHLSVFSSPFWGLQVQHEW